MKLRAWIFLGISVVSIVVFFIFGLNDTENEEIPLAEVMEGEFLIEITTTGELQAEKSQLITAPASLGILRLQNVKITDMVSEGTLVDSGQYVATLDRTELNTRIEKYTREIDEINREISSLLLDTALRMKEMHDKIENIKYSLKDAEIRLEQSEYEPPAVQRQNKISVESIKRTLSQSERNIEIQRRNLTQKIEKLTEKLRKKQQELSDHSNAVREFTVNAPSNGMVIYYQYGRGRKIEVGDNVSVWRPSIATLPDLSSFISVASVNETDIRKVYVGQGVAIEIDAFPDEKFSGTIASISNIGFVTEQSGMKAFEIVVKINGNVDKLLPSMTSNNRILIEKFDKVLYVPLEAVHSNDSISYVFKAGFKTQRQVVKVGKANENDIIIESGLQKGDKVLLAPPKNAEDLPLEI